MKFTYLLGIFSIALIHQASGAGLSLSPSSTSVGASGGTYSFFVNESHSSFGGNDDWRWTREASRETEYTDQGATCLDEVDGDLSHAVEVSGDVVNLRQPGTYIIRYNCEDSAGNEADEVIRTILVKDTQPPVITLAGDDTVNVEAGFAYEDPGANAEDSLDGNITVTIDDTGVDTNIVGSYTLTYNVTDAAGNESEVTRTVNVIVTRAPAITNLAGVGVPKTLNALSITFASYLNASYIIEYSRDLVNWERVREVQGEAQTTTITIDEPILDGGGVYYRVGVKID